METGLNGHPDPSNCSMSAIKVTQRMSHSTHGTQSLRTKRPYGTESTPTQLQLISAPQANYLAASQESTFSMNLTRDSETNKPSHLTMNNEQLQHTVERTDQFEVIEK